MVDLVPACTFDDCFILGSQPVSSDISTVVVPWRYVQKSRKGVQSYYGEIPGRTARVGEESNGMYVSSEGMNDLLRER